MCVVCGCEGGDEDVVGARASSRADGAHVRVEPTVDPATGDLHFGAGPARVSVPGMSPVRAIEIESDVLGENARLAAMNRARFRSHAVTAYDLVSSPGSGKTTLLCRTIGCLAERCPSLPVAVIEGDQQTSLDADRLRAAGARAVQVNTGKGCHLDAAMVGAAVERLGLPHGGPGALLLIENVGNLVCPAMWDLGEAAKVVILSVTEGADKPLKYPDMFAAADLLVLNKIDLLPHVDFDVERCIDAARRINPDIETVLLSATTGEGVGRWIDWLLRASAAPDSAS